MTDKNQFIEYLNNQEWSVFDLLIETLDKVNVLPKENIEGINLLLENLFDLTQDGDEVPVQTLSVEKLLVDSFQKGSQDEVLGNESLASKLLSSDLSVRDAEVRDALHDLQDSLSGKTSYSKVNTQEFSNPLQDSRSRVDTQDKLSSSDALRELGEKYSRSMQSFEDTNETMSYRLVKMIGDQVLSLATGLGISKALDTLIQQSTEANQIYRRIEYSLAADKNDVEVIRENLHNLYKESGDHLVTRINETEAVRNLSDTFSTFSIDNRDTLIDLSLRLSEISTATGESISARDIEPIYDSLKSQNLGTDNISLLVNDALTINKRSNMSTSYLLKSVGNISELMNKLNLEDQEYQGTVHDYLASIEMLSKDGSNVDQQFINDFVSAFSSTSPEARRMQMEYTRNLGVDGDLALNAIRSGDISSGVSELLRAVKFTNDQLFSTDDPSMWMAQDIRLERMGIDAGVIKRLADNSDTKISDLTQESIKGMPQDTQVLDSTIDGHSEKLLEKFKNWFSWTAGGEVLGKVLYATENNEFLGGIFDTAKTILTYVAGKKIYSGLGSLFSGGAQGVSKGAEGLSKGLSQSSAGVSKAGKVLASSVDDVAQNVTSASKWLGRFGTVLTVALSIFEGISAWRVGRDMKKSGDYEGGSEHQYSGIGKALGGGVGTLGGAAAGSAIGSALLPGPGTVIGAILGGLGGGAGGGATGKFLGGKFYDSSKSRRDFESTVAGGNFSKDDYYDYIVNHLGYTGEYKTSSGGYTQEFNKKYSDYVATMSNKVNSRESRFQELEGISGKGGEVIGESSVDRMIRSNRLDTRPLGPFTGMDTSDYREFLLEILNTSNIINNKMTSGSSGGSTNFMDGVVAGGDTLGVMTGSGIEEQLWSYFESLGYADGAIAGILGNFKQESNFDTTTIGDGGTSYGLAQWHNERWTGLQNFASSINRTQDDPLAQAAYFHKELTAMPGGKAYTQMTDPRQAALWISDEFERPDPRYANNSGRQAYAQQFYDQLRGQTMTGKMTINERSPSPSELGLVRINNHIGKGGDPELPLITSFSEEYTSLLDTARESMDKSKSEYEDAVSIGGVGAIVQAIKESTSRLISESSKDKSSRSDESTPKPSKPLRKSTDWIDTDRQILSI